MTKTPNTSWKNYVLFISGLLIGASTFLLVQASYTVQTNIENAVQVIKKIIVEKANGNTGSILSGDTIMTVNMKATKYCNEDGAHCTDIADVYTGTDSFAEYSGYYYDKTGVNNLIATVTGEMDDRFYEMGNYITGNYYDSGEVDNRLSDITGYINSNFYNSGIADNKFLTGELWSATSNNIYYTGGNVGIGTDDPINMLSIGGLTNNKVIINIGAAKNAVFIDDFNFLPKIYGKQNNSNAWMLGISDEMNDTTFGLKSWGSRPITFHTNDNERVRIDTDGNVGIGTDNPQATLDVSGTVKFNGYTSIKDYPCRGEANEGSIFYNKADGYFCFCTIEGGGVGVGAEKPVATGKKLHAPDRNCY